MLIFRRAADLQAFLQRRKTHGRSLGFVPTMGALHEGHLALVDQSSKDNQLTVASIFVNPTQFNETDDLEAYPRTPGKDCERLAEVGCELVFLPTIDEVYPQGTHHHPHQFDFQYLDKRFEGEHRPGHFQGVAQVVTRLLELVQPDTLYLGQKDAQQVAILQHTLSSIDSPTQIQVVDIVRAADGLALSSRNQRLTTEQRQQAPTIYEVMKRTSAGVEHGQAVQPLLLSAIRDIHRQSELKVEYLELVDPTSFKPIDSYDRERGALLVAAVWAGQVRLIDNIRF